MFPQTKDINLDTKIHVTSPLRPGKIESTSKSLIVGLEDESKPRGSVFLGKISETCGTKSFYNYNLWIDVSFPHIIFIAGRRGTGKSYTLGVIAEGLISKENTKISTVKEFGYSVLLIDTLGQFWQTKYTKPGIVEKEHESLIKKWGLDASEFKNVDVYVPKGCNVLFPDWKIFTIKVSELDLDDWCGLLGEDRYQSRMGQLMSQIYDKVVIKGYTYVKRHPETGNIIERKNIDPKENYSLSELIECLDFSEEIISTILGFERRTIRALRSRLVNIRSWKVFDKKGFSVEEIFKKGSLTVVNLQEADYGLKSLIVGILTKKIFKGRMEARASEEAEKINKKNIIKKPFLPPGWVLIDEAHNYCPDTEITAAKEWLIKYAKEGRSLGLGLIATTQQPSSLSSKLSSQIDMLISHGVAFSQDISAVESLLLNDLPDNVRIENESIGKNILTRVLRSLKRGNAIISTLGANRIFHVKIRPRLGIHGGKPPMLA